MTSRYITLIFLVAASTALGNEGYWNQFRGPNGDGKTLAKNLPVEFSETKNVRWKTPIHDKGYSSPVVWGGQIWLTTAREDGSELFAICVDLESGKVIHDIKVFDVAKPQLQDPHLNSHASPTPVVEEGSVYVHFGTYGTACLDSATGEKLWERRDLQCDHRVRPASSPIIDRDSLFVAFDGIDNQFFMALDKNTGETQWLRDRKVQSDWVATLKGSGIPDPEEVLKEKPGDNKKSYATAKLIEHEGRRQLIAPAAEATISYDPDSGAELWRVHHYGGFNVACRPLFEHGLVYIFTSGLTGHLLAVRPSGSGDVTDTHIAWSTTKGTPHIPSPLLVDDLMFMVTDKGIARCLEAKSGREVWKERLGGGYWASPVYADGKIYCFSKEGEVSVISATRNYQLLAQNQFEDGFIASPAFAGDAMILRSLTHLCYVAEGYESPPQTVVGEPKPQLPKKIAGKQSINLDDLAETLKAAVADGKITKEEALAKYNAVVSSIGGGQEKTIGKGKSVKDGMIKKRGKMMSDGRTGFYAIVIGRLRSKDVELGQFTLEVDHVTSMYQNQWVKDTIIGKTITVNGVSGRMLDNLLLMNRGETLKFRSGSINGTTISFGSKFSVLERAAPFDPDVYAVPPEGFRGFQGVLSGKIVELDQGYELALRVDKVHDRFDGNAAADASRIEGKLVRLTGFYAQPFKNTFEDLHVDDSIRVGAAHSDRTSDTLEVSELLEKAVGQN